MDSRAQTKSLAAILSMIFGLDMNSMNSLLGRSEFVDEEAKVHILRIFLLPFYGTMSFRILVFSSPTWLQGNLGRCEKSHSRKFPVPPAPPVLIAQESKRSSSHYRNQLKTRHFFFHSTWNGVFPRLKFLNDPSMDEKSNWVIYLIN